MAWTYLIVAGLFEVVWVVSMKSTDGLTRFRPSVLTVGASIVSFVLLAQALRTLPVGTGYAVWTGIGAVGATFLGIILFAESSSPVRLLCIALIVTGIVGLKLTTNS